ncbi:ATP-grasp domain-containing protein [Tautonia rosea]|uniref:ATP-grasp domain-containing protein n=1 Tax=Tautonia rosea TaxID=2728037 RepID=UPI0014751D8E|nr:ATP-grasp domain-containing protein [Tautonia rosea]
MAELVGDSVTWVLEPGVFPRSYEAMRDAVLGIGAGVVIWEDDWLRQGGWPSLRGRAVIFHGSLGNADAIARGLPWQPGAFCDAEAFRCSRWYPKASRWLLHRRWVVVALNQLVDDPGSVLAPLGHPDAVFVRPDSPLKPFSGRVVRQDGLSLRAFDHGFYFDDETLPVVVAPVRQVEREWRYVVVGRDVVAGNSYEADGRIATADDPNGAPRRFAGQIARDLELPQEVSVLDVCEADGDLHLLELNPFSGADLYACDRPAVVDAVSRVALSIVGTTADPGSS